MKLTWILGIASAVLLHVFVLLFGDSSSRAPRSRKPRSRPSTCSTTSTTTSPRTSPLEDEKKDEDLEADAEKPPDAAELVKSLEPAPVNDAPALDAASLSAIEAALNGQTGGGEFGEALSFASGGRIGGTGKPGAVGESVETAFSMAEIDQKPRPIFQGAPMYPAELRGKKIEGSVSVIFVVDATGKVTDPRVEKSDHPAFDKPALAAVRQWKFEPAVKGGKRVPCKMRQPIRFQPR
jgi:protein TonB